MFLELKAGKRSLSCLFRLIQSESGWSFYSNDNASVIWNPRTPTPPPHPHSGLSGGLGGLSPQIHPILIPWKAGNSLEATVFASPTGEISGAVTAQVLFLFWNNLIVSILTITINNCQYLVSLPRKYFLFVIMEHTSEQDCFYSGFPKETPELKFRLRFFFRSATVCNSLINTHARRFYWWAQGMV